MTYAHTLLSLAMFPSRETSLEYLQMMKDHLSLLPNLTNVTKQKYLLLIQFVWLV